MDFPPKDVPLRDDVRTLGALLGEVIREQEGDALFNAVEGARKAAIARDDEALRKILDKLGPPEAMRVVRSFSSYFGLVNMAERIHRIRRRRDSLRPGAPPQRGSFEAVLRSLRESGVTLDGLQTALERMRIEPVLTAHPTEAVRPVLLLKEQRIARALVDRLEREAAIPIEEDAALGRIKEEVSIAWQTEEHLDERPGISDEVEHVLFYLAEVVYRIIPAFYEELETAVQQVYGSSFRVPTFIRFATWVGGDMDGNPAVGPDTISTTLRRMRELIETRYRIELQDLAGRLSQSVADPEILERAGGDAMPYRKLLTALAEDPGSETGLLEDLRGIEASLVRHKGGHAGLHRVRRLIRRIETFGMQMATLDVRQDALEHRNQVAEIIDGFEEQTSEERTRLLEEALPKVEPGRDPVFDAMRGGQIGPYIISMTQGPDDVLALLYLARRAGFEELDIAPLFETVGDLSNARATFERLLGNATYREHVRRRGDRQVVMIGYSDSSKESGVAASRWALYRAQVELVEAARDAGVRLELFHGRGGTVSRGGSKPRAAILAEPPGAVSGLLRVTEQGEIINAKYGLRGIAVRTLELMSGAVLEATLKAAPEPKQEWLEAMEIVAREGRAAFRALCYEDPDFYTYFREATPIDVIERLTIGSRPASRRTQRGIGDLRAIPWVFSWTQNRHILPGWYGLGTALEKTAIPKGMTEWPFFDNLLADVEMAMAKAVLPIAERYSKLSTVGDAMFPRIREEFERTRGAILKLRGTKELLEGEPVLRRSIRLRNPYVEPMSFLQIELLRRWRAGGCRDRDLERALFSTVKGIARGMQNTG